MKIVYKLKASCCTAALWALILQVTAQELRTLPNPYLLTPNEQGEQLRFVHDPDSIAPFNIGWVETVSGKQILKNGLGNVTTYFEDDALLEGIFVLYDPGRPEPSQQSDPMQYQYNLLAFNQKGELLYHPFWYDNGPDYFAEGRRRYVENGKMGLVNRLGERVIPAMKYRFLSAVRNGYVLACKDCRYHVYDPADSDHGVGYKGTDFDILDKDGNRIASFQLREDAERGAAYRKMRSLVEGRHLPVDTAASKLAALLKALPETAAAVAKKGYLLSECTYICYDTPSTSSPYYHFGLQEQRSGYVFDSMQFLITPGRETILHISPSMNSVTPYDEWKKQ